MYLAQKHHLSLDWAATWRHAKRSIKSLPFVAKIDLAYQRRRYFSTAPGHPYFGCFRSFEEARAWLPPSNEFDTTALVDEYVTVRTNRIFAYDYPVIYWLGRAFHGGATRILDIGGSVGVHFKAYRPYLTYPSSILWKVIEVPAIAALGRELAPHDALHALTFADSLAAVEWPADVWLSSGAIHYIEQGHVARLLDRAHSRPGYIILNKLPLYDGEDFVSTQRVGPHHYAPLHVYRRDRFVGAIEALGYALVDQWEVPERSFYLPGHSDKSFAQFSGLCFRQQQRADSL